MQKMSVCLHARVMLLSNSHLLAHGRTAGRIPRCRPLHFGDSYHKLDLSPPIMISPLIWLYGQL